MTAEAEEQFRKRIRNIIRKVEVELKKEQSTSGAAGRAFDRRIALPSPRRAEESMIPG